MPDIPLMKEDHISEIPALQLLQNLGWKYLRPEGFGKGVGSLFQDVFSRFGYPSAPTHRRLSVLTTYRIVTR